MATDAEKYRETVRKMMGDVWRDGLMLTGPTMADRIAAALAAAAAEAQEVAAKVADLDAERTKHTSHADGIGMGCQREEAVALRIAAAIRALSRGAKEEGRG